VARYKNEKYPCLTVNVRPEEKVYHPSMPVIVKTIPAIVAQFGVIGPEYQVENADGEITTHVDISGGLFDLDAETATNGWTEEEKQLVKARLDDLCTQAWSGVELVEDLPPAAPWPTYDDTHHAKIATLAAELGLVEQALAYENATKQRVGVLSALLEKQETAVVEEELTAA
jgi:hypothetical protein